jgi:predicted phosphate transport protein (TIGR00153 family)
VFKKKDIFFRTLEQMADVIVLTVDRFAAAVHDADLPNMAEFTKEMKELEHQGDQYTHTVITELNKTFITPIEREDIMELIKRLDDVLDGIEACVNRFDMYQIRKSDVYIRNFADCLRRCAIEIKSAIYLLTQKKLLAMQPHCVNLHELENEGDLLMRQGIKHLFQNVQDPIELIKSKELYERLEETTDSCEHVANTLQSIIMRNS